MSDEKTTPADGAPESDIEALLARFASAHYAGRSPDLEAFCRAHDSSGDELRARIEAFLQTDRQCHPETERIPSSIGHFKIRSVLGEGGMGVVYLAEQEGSIRRRVALKVIKPGMGSKAIIARFEAERQALALMDHPTIAKVYETGTTPEGQPFFAMEYVHGTSITDYCDRENLSLKDRIGIFMEVCHGVQHAHQKAVIHRDLKPSNILVTENEGKPVPKIIDFGLAKALGQKLTEMSLFTEQGMLVGTPEYISPEQVDPTARDVDTRTDIYSLGVILYRLLTSTLPFEMEDLRKAAQLAALQAIRKRICEEEPQKPSTRVSSSVNIGAEAARKRRLDPSTLTRRLRGDLDWITMKALEKDRARRYATATELAADLRRHLDHEPVTAGPPGTAYRLKKFVRKNAATVVALAVIFLAVLAGGATATAFYFRSERDRNLADERRIEAEKATARETEAKEREAEQRKEAENARTLAQEKEKEAVAARNEVLRLADIKRLQARVAEADELWPAYPDKIGAMENWLARADELVRNLPTHRDSLARLREEAIERPTAPDGEPSDGATTEGEGAQEAELSGGSRESGQWRFADTETQWRHDVLVELTDGLVLFLDTAPAIGAMASVKERLAFARTVHQETIEKYDVEWEEAIASIANVEESPAYHGLRMKPQIGLVPIGKDPASGLWEFAHIQTGEIPDRDEEGKILLTGETGLVFVLIPGGTFGMGAQKEDEDKPNYDPQAVSYEGPAHQVTLTPFFLSKYEMTQGQWERFTGKNPSLYTSGGLVPMPPLHPVEQVTWEDCDRVLSRLDLALPTEAQWEYAARGGTTTVWSTGNDRDSLIGAANLADQAAQRAGAAWPEIKDWPELDDKFAVHAPVGSYRANPFGLHDVHGSVWEWCRDWFTGYDQPVRDGDGARLLSGGRARVYRGGSFIGPASGARSAIRSNAAPEFRFSGLGCRPSRVATE